MVFHRADYPAGLHCPEELARLSDIPCRGGSCIVDPYGHYVVQPVWDREDIAMEALARVGMDDRAHHRPSQMSGGQQQRVAIARAIATHPPIIMADEPTGALDSKTGRHVLEILRELYREGTTILLITHDDGIAATARRVVRLSDGKIIADHPQEVDWA